MFRNPSAKNIFATNKSVWINKKKRKKENINVLF